MSLGCETSVLASLSPEGRRGEEQAGGLPRLWKPSQGEVSQVGFVFRGDSTVDKTLMFDLPQRPYSGSGVINFLKSKVVRENYLIFEQYNKIIAFDDPSH